MTGEPTLKHNTILWQTNGYTEGKAIFDNFACFSENVSKEYQK